MKTVRGLFCLLALPFHTAILGALAILSIPLSPSGDLILKLGRLWSRIILFTAGVRVRSVHPERSAGGPYVIFSNHQSHFDIPALVATLTGNFRVVAKQGLFWIPIFGWALRLAGFVPIDRSRRDRAIASFSVARQRIQQGQSMVVFVEGTRSLDGNLARLKKGGFHLAKQAGVPILPVTISGTRAVLARTGWIPRPGLVDVIFGEPLAQIDPNAEVNAELVERTAAALRAGYSEIHRRDLDPDTAAPKHQAATEP